MIWIFVPGLAALKSLAIVSMTAYSSVPPALWVHSVSVPGLDPPWDEQADRAALAAAVAPHQKQERIQWV